MLVSNRNLLFQRSIFRCYVIVLEGLSIYRQKLQRFFVRFSSRHDPFASALEVAKSTPCKDWNASAKCFATGSWGNDGKRPWIIGQTWPNVAEKWWITTTHLSGRSPVVLLAKNSNLKNLSLISGRALSFIWSTDPWDCCCFSNGSNATPSGYACSCHIQKLLSK